MIDRDYFWIWSYNEENECDRDTLGKWCVITDVATLEKFFPAIDDLVEEGKIYQAKYSHQNNPDYDLVSYPDPLLCVYADNDTRDKTLKLLEELGLETDEWLYN